MGSAADLRSNRSGPAIVRYRKAARQRRLALERELAGYNTPDQRCDLEATLDRYPDGVTHELREILSQQRMAQQTRHIAGIGHY